MTTGFSIGDVVFKKKRGEQKTAMVVTGFFQNSPKNTEIICKWISCQGKPKREIFNKSEILKKDEHTGTHKY